MQSLLFILAFEMLDHTRLLKRATEIFGLNDHVVNLLKSYLTDRSSYNSIGNYHSVTVGSTAGVPQSSVLGSLLFSIFTAPIGRLYLHLQYIVLPVRRRYATITIYTSVDSSWSADINRLSLCAEAVTKWHLENSLLLNPLKNRGTSHRYSTTIKSPSSMMLLQFHPPSNSPELVFPARLPFVSLASPLINI